MHPFGSDLSKRTQIFIKICGLCSVQDALTCASHGVNAVGMLLRPSDAQRKPNSDRLSVEEAAFLVSQLPPNLLSVLLVHSRSMEEIFRMCADIGPSALQIQKEVAPQELSALRNRLPNVSLIKTFGVAEGENAVSLVGRIKPYLDTGSIDAVLLDSARGGSGKIHNWDISAEVVRRLPDTRVILAGGLSATNVNTAIKQVRPFGGDVMTYVNSSSRDRKDPDKIRSFVDSVREASTYNV